MERRRALIYGGIAGSLAAAPVLGFMLERARILQGQTNTESLPARPAAAPVPVATDRTHSGVEPWEQTRLDIKESLAIELLPREFSTNPKTQGQYLTENGWEYDVIHLEAQQTKIVQKEHSGIKLRKAPLLQDHPALIVTGGFQPDEPIYWSYELVLKKTTNPQETQTWRVHLVPITPAGDPKASWGYTIRQTVEKGFTTNYLP